MCDEGHDDIIVRLESLAQAFREYNGDQKETRDDVITIKNYLIGDLDADKKGLAERVRKIEDWVADQKKMYYLVISVFITQIIGWIFVLIVR